MQPTTDLTDRPTTEVIPFLARHRFPELAVTQSVFGLCRGGQTHADRMLAGLIDQLERAGALTSAHTTALMIVGGGLAEPLDGTALDRLWTGAISTLAAHLQAGHA